MVWNTRALLLLALLPLACGPDIVEAASDEADTEGDSEDEIGDESSSSSGSTDDESSTSDDESSSDDTSSDESSSDESSSDDTSSDESSTSDETTSDDESTTDTTSSESESDTVIDTACTEPTSFMVEDIEWTSGYNWQPTMSMLGEGMVLSVIDQNEDAVANFEVEIPCDDTWHVWVRAIEDGSDDSLWARVDGQPMDWAVFELDCTNGPNMTAYKWKELNWRDVQDPSCTYVQDPWTQDWAAGAHTVSFGYRESWAIARIWFTNTDQPPP